MAYLLAYCSLDNWMVSPPHYPSPCISAWISHLVLFCVAIGHISIFINQWQ